MITYNVCPRCGTENEGEWFKKIVHRPYFIVRCIICGNLYNQMFKVQEPEHLKCHKNKWIKDSEERVPIKFIKIDPKSIDLRLYLKGRAPLASE